MKLDAKKRMAAKVLKTSKKKVVFDTERLNDIKEALTKNDIKNLVSSKAIKKKPSGRHSRGKARKLHEQKVKGRQSGHGSRKGTKNARKNKKETWMEKIRSQRAFIKMLKEKGKISPKTYRDLYAKCKGGFFRSKRHINLYLTEKELFVSDKNV